MPKTEPAAVAAALAAAISVVVLLVFKHELSQEESAAIIGVVTLLAGLWTRSKVSPVA
jgi:hypothetical protein